MEPSKSASIRIVLRFFGLISGAIVIASITSKLLDDFTNDYKTEKYCLFYITPTSKEPKTTACEFGIACGAVAVLMAIVFCALDFMVDVYGSAKSIRRPVIAVSIGFAVIMALLWVSCFGYLTELWINAHGNNWKNEYKIPGQATLSFSFLSIITWILVAVFGFVGLQASS